LVDYYVLDIGYAVAEAAVEHGAIVIVSSSNPARVEQAVSKLQRTYPSASAKISGYPCNLNNEDTLESNIVQLLENTGPGIDYIVHTAADAIPLTPLADSDV
jgi:NAD(P)-dependent dehydrogenase (short-subunit alcohol dehydrogenase family)